LNDAGLRITGEASRSRLRVTFARLWPKPGFGHIRL
jgi:hypothetical protein